MPDCLKQDGIVSSNPWKKPDCRLCRSNMFWLLSVKDQTGNEADTLTLLGHPDPS